MSGFADSDGRRHAIGSTDAQGGRQTVAQLSQTGAVISAVIRVDLADHSLPGWTDVLVSRIDIGAGDLASMYGAARFVKVGSDQVSRGGFPSRAPGLASRMCRSAARRLGLRARRAAHARC